MFLLYLIYFWKRENSFVESTFNQNVIWGRIHSSIFFIVFMKLWYIMIIWGFLFNIHLRVHTYMKRRRRLCCILSYSTFGIQRILLHTMYVVYIWQVIDIKYICVEKIIHEILYWLAKPKGDDNSKKSEWICNEGQHWIT